MLTKLYDADRELSGLGIDVPDWVDPDITTSTIAAICEGGCDSGAYMPAVTYWDAARTMDEHGDDVLGYLANVGGITVVDASRHSWPGSVAVFFLSQAVDAWASSVAEECEEALESEDD
jgi:hypothetical protein